MLDFPFETLGSHEVFNKRIEVNWNFIIAYVINFFLISLYKEAINK